MNLPVVQELDTDRPTADKLNASFPLDTERRLQGAAGSTIVDHVLGLISARENKVRKLTAAAQERRALTVEVLISNLAVAASNRVNPSRYVAVPFRKNSYTGLPISYDAMVLARNILIEQRLIEYHPGYYRRHHYEDFAYRQVSRMRATDALRAMFDRFDIRLRTVQHLRERLIKLNRMEPDSGSEPVEVTASRETLKRINTRLDAISITLPDEVWPHLADTAPEGAEPEAELDRLHLGDLTTNSLYRVFTGNWNKGGRFYGGWWVSLPSKYRRLLRIDGEATVEIDYRNLHPALLYRIRGHTLDRDPYHLPPYSRDLCKETFQRLLNRTPSTGGANIRKAKKYGPPAGTSFARFLEDYKDHLAAVADCFGKGIGLHLQRADSELALSIMDALDRQDVAALPVHDSFIVKIGDREILEATMRQVFRDQYEVEPELRVTYPVE